MTESLLRNCYTFLSGVRAQVPDALWMLALFGAAVLQVLVPPVPGDAALCATGIVSAPGAPAYGAQYLLCYWLGSVVACIALYELGRAKGQELLRRPWFERQMRRRSVARAGSLLHRRGHWALLVTKFIPGVNSVAVAFTGASRAPRLACYAAMAVACAAHNGALFLLGLLLGDSFWAIAAMLRGVSTAGLLVLLVGVAVAFWGYGRLRRKEENAHE